MLSLDDPMWKELHGGYRIPYDASSDLRRLEQAEDVWDVLWEELHHQGDVGEASYAAVPHLVRIMKQACQRDWNLYGLVSTIEIERHRKTNPLLPAWLEEDYKAAWADLLELALSDLRETDNPVTLRSILGAVALAKRQLKLGVLIACTDESQTNEILDQYEAWSELYRESDNG